MKIIKTDNYRDLAIAFVANILEETEDRMKKCVENSPGYISDTEIAFQCGVFEVFHLLYEKRLHIDAVNNRIQILEQGEI